MGVRAAGGSASMTWPARDIAETLAILTAPGAPFEMAEVEIGGRRPRSHVRMPPNLRSLFGASRRFGARHPLVYEEERLTFGAHLRAPSAIGRTEGHTSEIPAPMRHSHAVVCLKKKKTTLDA